MLELAEKQLAASGGQRLILSDIAAAMAMSQSNAHRYFRTKSDLVRALAERWFDAVERDVDDAIAAATSPRAALNACILATLRSKRARHDADPVLFRAYLALASEHRDIVQMHSDRLSERLRGVLAGIVPEDGRDAALALVEDATVQFRVPAMIALAPHRATEARALAVLDALWPTLSDAGSVGKAGKMG